MKIKLLTLLVPSLFALASCGFLPEESIPSTPSISYESVAPIEVEYTVLEENGSYIIISITTDATEAFDLEIMSSYGGLAVTGIYDEAFLNCTVIKSVTIPSSIVSIGTRAFKGCTNLTSATFASTSGWSADTTSLSSEDLSDTSVAATYLTSTYVEVAWTRN